MIALTIKRLIPLLLTLLAGTALFGVSPALQADIPLVDKPSAAVFVKLTGDADDARSDVYTQSLTGGEAKLLVAHTALPETFRGRIERALPSADGSLLLLKESAGHLIRNKGTGAMHVALGDSYSVNGQETVEQFGGDDWLWSRATGAIKKIPLTGVHEHAEPLGWSPRGELLLAHVMNEKTSSETLRLFDAGTGKTRTVLTVHEFIFASWTPDGAGVLVGEQPNWKTTRLMLIPLNGKAQRLFTRPGLVFTAVISPDGRHVALGDKDGFYLISRDGRAKRKLAVPAIEGLPSGNMAFSADGGRLAMLFSSAGSGLYANINEELWVIEIATAAAQRLSQWETTLGNSPGEDNTHMLLGWAPGQPALLVMSRSCTLQGAETEWSKLWLQSTDPASPASLLADTGPYGIDMSWWGGQP